MGRDGITRYYWKPESRLRKLGWCNVNLGTEKSQAERKSIILNTGVATKQPIPINLQILRAATTDDVKLALAFCETGNPTTHHDALLEFFHHMLDLLVGVIEQAWEEI